MKEIANKFSISELQSILIYLSFGSSIANLIQEIENPDSDIINPKYRGKFKNMLPRLRTITAAEENTLKEFSIMCENEILSSLQPLYTED